MAQHVASAFLETLVPVAIAVLYAGLQRDTIGRRTCCVSPRVTQGAATELKYRIISEDTYQGRHVPNMNSA